MQESFLFYQADRYDVKGKEYLKTGGKYYAVDMGLRRTVLGNKSADAGHILENVIYLELLRRGFDVYVGKVDTLEVDFVAMDQTRIVYYQVAETVRARDTLQRELAPLQKITDHDLVPSVSYDGIKQVYALDWLLGKS